VSVFVLFYRFTAGVSICTFVLVKSSAKVQILTPDGEEAQQLLEKKRRPKRRGFRADVC
jgi:hypothetical protein